MAKKFKLFRNTKRKYHGTDEWVTLTDVYINRELVVVWCHELNGVQVRMANGDNFLLPITPTDFAAWVDE